MTNNTKPAPQTNSEGSGPWIDVDHYYACEERAEAPHRPQRIDPRWMSIDQINEQIAALEAELRSRAALATEGKADE